MLFRAARSFRLAYPVRLTLVGLLLPLLGGCGGLGPDSGSAVALIRFVQVSPGSPEMDFFVNGTGAAYGLGYESFTSYLPVTPGAATFRVSRSNRSVPLATGEATLESGRQYTVVLSQGLADLRPVTLVDQEHAAAPGEFDLRIVNAVSGVPGLMFHLTNEKGVPELPETAIVVKSGNASSYLHLAPGHKYAIAATGPNAGMSTVWNTATLYGEPGAVRTVIFGGTVEHATHPHLVSFVLSDADPT